MTNLYRLRIDIFPHILTTKYKESVLKIIPPSRWGASQTIPALWDLDSRFKIMDKYEVTHVLTMLSPGIEDFADPEKAVDLAKLANDELAELVYKYPERFPAAVASLPMNNIDAALKEMDRAINDLGFRGIQIFTSINGKPLDSPEFMPLYEKMSQQYNLPIWIHPDRPRDHPDYKTENKSKYNVWIILGWPYETSVTMTRLVFSGVLEKYPNLKIIAHHCGAMIPFFAQRITGVTNFMDTRSSVKSERILTRSPLEYYKMFYGDTSLYGNTPGLMCAYHFFGADHMLFGTDMPLDSQLGECFTRETINAIEQMDISSQEKQLIYEDNARKLLRLPI